MCHAVPITCVICFCLFAAGCIEPDYTKTDYRHIPPSWITYTQVSVTETESVPPYLTVTGSRWCATEDTLYYVNQCFLMCIPLTAGYSAAQPVPLLIFPFPFTVYQSPITVAVNKKYHLLHVTNPGKHRIETFSLDGIYLPELSWGYASAELNGFCGCCNPVAVAAMPDGRIITAEKGVSRVKIYRIDGTLDCIVAGPSVLDRYRDVSLRYTSRSFGVAALPDETIAVYDFNRHLLRIFRENTRRSDRTSAKP